MPGRETFNKLPIGHFDISFYPSERDFRDSNLPAARVVFPSQSGNRAKCELVVPHLFEVENGVLESQNTGIIAQIDAIFKQDTKSIDSNLTLEYITKPGGTERIGNGPRVEKFEIQRFKSTESVTEGISKVLHPKRFNIVSPHGQAADWVVVVKAIKAKSPMDRYLEEKSSAIDKPYQDAIAELKLRYQIALTNALRNGAGKGDESVMKAFFEELELLKKGIPSPERVTADSEFTNLQTVFHQDLAKLESQRQAAMAKLGARFPNIAATIKREADKKPKPQPVVAPKAPTTSSPPLPTPIVSPDKSPSGRLFFHGTYAGKPANVPKELIEEPIDWIEILNNGRFLVGTINKGVYLATPEKGFSRLFPKRCFSYVFSPVFGWGKTYLDDDGVLHWKNRQSSGTVKDVTAFDYGGSSESGALLALKENGEIQLLTFNIDMQWDFEKWASQHRFRDIAMVRAHGIHAVALALTQTGQLFAFSAKGFYQLDDEISRGVMSISSGHTAIHLGLVTDNGDVFEFARGRSIEGITLEDYLKNWRRTARSKFDEKTPVKFHCGHYARAIEFQDGSYAAYPGRGPIVEQVLSEEIEGKRLKGLGVCDINGQSSFIVGIR
ncbi:MAG: hypothetical protein P1U89_15610 [Verrucomicrobiales bacterium]|nr:hypothetical protein [Verrucomicrobiales bacterium]